MQSNDRPSLRVLPQADGWWPQDTITGTPGDDTLTGTAGDDTLAGGLGADQMTGGDGADTYIVDNAGDVVVELAPPGSFQLDRVFSTVDYLLPNNVEWLILSGTDDLNGTGNSASNQITGNAGANRLTGGRGLDTLKGMDGDDWLDGGDDSDSLYGGAGNDTLLSGSGNDTMFGESGDDHLVLTTQGSAFGGDGDDLLEAGTNDGYSLNGGAGNDTVVGGDLVGHDPSISGGGGNDLVIARVGSPLDGDGGNDTLQGSSGRDQLNGGSGADLLIGNAGPDMFVDEDREADTCVGGNGDDMLQMDLSSRDAVLMFQNRPDTEQQFVGNTISSIDGFWLTLGDGDDLLDNRLGSGADQINAGAGNDTLQAGGGNDTLNGDIGNDVLAAGAGTDFVTDFDTDVDTLLGGSGIDILSADWSELADDIVWVNDGVNTVDVNGQQIGGFEQLWVTLGSGNDSVRSTADGSDRIECQDGNDLLDTGAGRDELYGGNGNDTLTGGSGDDWLVGENGRDTLEGGTGSDTLYGGNGVDRYVFGAPDAVDTARGFVSGEDRFVVTQSLLPIGDGDGRVEGAQTIAAPGGHDAAAELVIATADIKGAITADKAAAAIGSATGSYAAGQSALFVVDNGHDSAAYLFVSAGADADVGAGELTLMVTLELAKATVVDDYLFGA